MGGITADTQRYIVHGADGYLSIDGVDLGATIGDFSVKMETDEYYPNLAQARGKVVGTGKIVGGSGSITATLAEWTFAILKTLFSSGYSSDANSETLGSGALGTVTELSNVMLTGISRSDDAVFQVTIPHARVTSPIATTLAKTNESGLEVVFESLFTGGAMRTLPIWFSFEKKYLLRDDFDDTRAAGSVNGTPATPGPGRAEPRSACGPWERAPAVWPPVSPFGADL